MEEKSRERGVAEARDVQLEKRIRNLQHQNMRMVVLVADEHAFARAPHPMLFVVLLEPLQPCEYRRVFFRLRLFCAKGVIAERVEPDWSRLGGGKGLWDCGSWRVC